ncbi:alpha/beta fold hydrolase [Sungkyunkwania multivorans]|uniref:Alpha/beta fold hydrolase n=1 Tax=Sungkyunkwania multivorans TaxID=1173618 RepID=A0ABW3CZZ2_9FLAO
MTLFYKSININYTIAGQGDTLVLLHGFLENQSMWDAFIPTLSQNRKVITVDLLGHGKTPCIGYVHTMEMMADAVFAVLRHEGVETFSVVGHSMGGYVALALAKKIPNMIETLCLLNSTPYTDSEERIKIRKRGIEAAKKNYGQVVRISVRNLFAKKSKILFPGEIEIVVNDALKTPLQGYIAAQEGMMKRSDQDLFLRESRFNKKLILAKDDPVLDSDLLQRDFQDSDLELVIIPDGHMSHIEQFFEVLNRLSKI